MTNESRGLEIKVGIFMLIGLGIIVFMAVWFGKLGQGLKKYYDLTIEFQNASGLLKGSDVYMAGARVGFTAEAPQLIEGRLAVRVGLRIEERVKIPRGSTFIILSAGFLGDASVNINPPDKVDLDDVLKSGEYLMGSRQEGFGELAAKGGDTLTELKKRLQELEEPIKDFRERVFSDKNLQAIDDTFAGFSKFASGLKETGKGLDDVIEKAKGAVETVRETVAAAKPPLEKIDAAAAELKPTIAEIKKAAAAADSALDSFRLLMNKAVAGKGALGMLLADKETADNLRVFIKNLRERGVLWYKNK